MLNVWIAECVNLWLRESVIAWIADCVKCWMCELLNVWISDCVNLWLRESLIVWIADCVNLWLCEMLIAWISDSVNLWLFASQVHEIIPPKHWKCQPQETCYIGHYFEFHYTSTRLIMAPPVQPSAQPNELPATPTEGARAMSMREFGVFTIKHDTIVYNCSGSFFI